MGESWAKACRISSQIPCNWGIINHSPIICSQLNATMFVNRLDIIVFFRERIEREKLREKELFEKYTSMLKDPIKLRKLKEESDKAPKIIKQIIRRYFPAVEEEWWIVRMTRKWWTIDMRLVIHCDVNVFCDFYSWNVTWSRLEHRIPGELYITDPIDCWIIHRMRSLPFEIYIPMIRFPMNIYEGMTFER